MIKYTNKSNMKKLLFLFFLPFIFSCTDEPENNIKGEAKLMEQHLYIAPFPNENGKYESELYAMVGAHGKNEILLHVDFTVKGHGVISSKSAKLKYNPKGLDYSTNKYFVKLETEEQLENSSLLKVEVVLD